MNPISGFKQMEKMEKNGPKNKKMVLESVFENMP